MEMLMQYIWQHRLWLPGSGLRTTDGRTLHIIDPGILNTDSGPDFFNAKISLDGHIWAGDVEIHIRASDWHRHHHSSNPAYDSVILHVVERDDTAIRRTNGETIPQLCMPCRADFEQHYRQLVTNAHLELSCAAHLSEIPPLHLRSWIDSLAYERIQWRTEHINALLQGSAGNWEETCYVVLARSLGFGKNGDCFERTALSLPLQFLAKHSDSTQALEALLFGQSSLLDADAAQPDDYSKAIAREYQYLKHKFSLTTPGFMVWKMSRMRPANLPHRRMATLAAMLTGGFRMLSQLLEVSTLQDGIEALSVTLPQYWATHHSFGMPSARPNQTAFSRSSIVSILINAVVPLQWAYGEWHGDSKLCTRAMDLLESLPPEQNIITRLFSNNGLTLPNAFATQAAIHLRRNYCEQRKCLYCRIGHRVLASHAMRPVP